MAWVAWTCAGNGPSDGAAGGAAAPVGGATGAAGGAGSGGAGAAGGSGGEAGGADGAAGTGGAVGCGGAAEGGACATPCWGCHGTEQSFAPPPDTDGNVGTTYRGVGAHQSHLAASSWHLQVPCTECHLVPAKPVWDPQVPTHQNGIVDLSWGPVAMGGIFDGQTLTCSYTYCHGTTLGPDPDGKSSIRTPQWTAVDGSQKACGAACHSLPPGGTHDPSPKCEDCHGEVIAAFAPDDPAASAWANAALHVNGKGESQEP
ncbi:MAG: hypothetical protein HY744_28400 [Deltaproteobacteria bacterium]|nr:hypothetical protein [Deltaproteobacteria bacterium]